MLSYFYCYIIITLIDNFLYNKLKYIRDCNVIFTALLNYLYFCCLQTYTYTNGMSLYEQI